MNLKNPPKNSFLLFLTVILSGIFIVFIGYGILLKPYFFKLASGNFNPLDLPRKELILLQLLQMIGLFLLPPVFYALISKNNVDETYNLNKPFIPIKYLLAILFVFVLYPVVINIQYFASNIPMPENIKAIADIQKIANEKAIAIFLDFPGWQNFVLMLLIIGFGAGLTEELFFRGLLMSLIGKWTKSLWAGIILSGLIFSAFHANVYDFIPISLIGILFGYIYSQTQDLKLNIFIHALFNSFQVLLNYLYMNKWISQDIDKIESFPIYVSGIGLVFSCIIGYFIIKKNEELSYTG